VDFCASVYTPSRTSADIDRREHIHAAADFHVFLTRAVFQVSFHPVFLIHPKTHVDLNLEIRRKSTRRQDWLKLGDSGESQGDAAGGFRRKRLRRPAEPSPQWSADDDSAQQSHTSE